MHNHRSNPRSQGGYNRSPQGRPFRGQQRQGRGQPRPLDERLFVNKAKVDVLLEAEVSTASFSDFKITDKLKRNISEHGYVHPTPIQEETIPHLLEGRGRHRYC